MRISNNTVRRTYNEISKHFSETRNTPWLEFEYFRKYVNKNDRILDLGCGNGRVYEFFKDYGITYYGLDISEKLINIAKKKYPEPNFKVGNMINLPYENNFFDTVWMIASFHHLRDKKERIQTLKEIKRVLKENGILIITVWNLYQIKYLKYVINGVYDRLNGKTKKINDLFIPWKKKDSTKIHRYYHAFLPNELFELIKREDYTVLEHFFYRSGEKQKKLFNSHNIIYICKR